MRAEFEEKQYEQCLNCSLIRDNRSLLPIGQVLENSLGLDVALFTGHPEFWRHFPTHHRRFCRFFYHLPKGVLATEFWRELELTLEEGDFPKFKFNAFIQHKRPEYMSVSRATEWPSWGSPYYRYRLITHQQQALSNLERIISEDGVVVYACPAFHKLGELFSAINKDEIIDRSNFCQAGKLDAHTVFTFQEPGNSGIAHSEPEKIESYNFLKRLEELRRSEQSKSNTEHIKKLADTVHSALSEIPEIEKLYKNIVQSVLDEEEDIPIKASIVKIYAFRFITNTDILIGF